MNLYLIEPDTDGAWEPFSQCRPLAELRAGAWLIRERWEGIADQETSAIIAPERLRAFIEDCPPLIDARPIEGPAIIGKSSFAPSGVRPVLGDAPARLVNEGDTVGWWQPHGTTWAPEESEYEEVVDVDGLVLHGAYDLVTALEHFLMADAADFTQERSDPIPEGVVVIGDPSDIVVLGAAIEPGVVFDTRGGPVVVEQHSHVRSGTRLIGPVYVGPGCEILGGDIGHSSLGPRCKVRGEVTATVFLGYANKAHEGFVGHSVIGRWVNLGAGTTTSNLKNTYGHVHLAAGGGRLDTGRQFLGSIIGDHVKTAIGTMFGTGTVVGWGANLFGDTRPPRRVKPFAWGDTGERLKRESFLLTASRVMQRRGVEFTDTVRTMLESLYDRTVG